jgi:hypothetical protein
MPRKFQAGTRFHKYLKMTNLSRQSPAARCKNEVDTPEISPNATPVKLTPPGGCHVEEKAEELLKKSALYKEFLAEREEILRHKWLESEKAGHDIGFERALLDWIVKHRTTWRRERLKKITGRPESGSR